MALLLPFTVPTGYGLGKSGWVTAKLADGEDAPVELFKEWIDESYRAQAPKRLVASLPAGGQGDSSRKAPPARGKKSATHDGQHRQRQPE